MEPVAPAVFAAVPIACQNSAGTGDKIAGATFVAK